jgi:hypothetical protein
VCVASKHLTRVKVDVVSQGLWKDRLSTFVR